LNGGQSRWTGHRLRCQPIDMLTSPLIVRLAAFEAPVPLPEARE
jgi:hypothetical protein